MWASDHQHDHPPPAGERQAVRQAREEAAKTREELRQTVAARAVPTGDTQLVALEFTRTAEPINLYTCRSVHHGLRSLHSGHIAARLGGHAMGMFESTAICAGVVSGLEFTRPAFVAASGQVALRLESSEKPRALTAGVHRILEARATNTRRPEVGLQKILKPQSAGVGNQAVTILYAMEWCEPIQSCLVVSEIRLDRSCTTWCLSVSATPTLRWTAHYVGQRVSGIVGLGSVQGGDQRTVRLRC